MSVIDIIRKVVPGYIKNREEADVLRFLLRTEKRRRKKKLDDLLFLSASALASFPYCQIKAVLKNEEEELNNFYYYLTNRILYSKKLGYYEEPKNVEDLLSIGNEITLNDINKLIKEKEREEIELEKRGIEIKPIPIIVTDKGLIVDMDLYRKSREYRMIVNSISNGRIIDMSSNPLARGKIMETELARKYVKFSWYKEMDGFIIVGSPDGITSNFVYEFKSTKNRFSLKYIKKIALNQANIYGVMFGRRNYLIQIYIIEEGTTLYIKEKVKTPEVYKLLKKFKNVYRKIKKREKLPFPEERWKCKKCRYKRRCIAIKSKTRIAM